MQEILKAEGLKKYFGKVKAVDGVDFSVSQGGLVALLGQNGAGKSTTINIICTLLKKDAGCVRVCGADVDLQPDEVRANIGVVFQGSIMDRTLSVSDNLLLRAGFYGLIGTQARERLKNLDGMLDLKEIFSRQYGKLSGGQRRRTDIARALIHTPKLLILDEPTTGLDPQSRLSVWETIENLRRETGMTVLLTTHYMEEADRADEIIIMDSGKIAAQGSPVSLKNRYSRDCVKLYAERSDETDALLKDYEVFYANDCYHIAVADSAQAKAFLNKFDKLAKDFEVTKGSMDDVFLAVTGKSPSGEEI